MSEEEKKAIEKLKEYALCKVNDNGYVEVSANGYKHTILNLIDDVLSHIKKQEKMIELMAEHISFGKNIQKILCSPKVHRKDECIGITCKRCIKQYFEKKADED